MLLCPALARVARGGTDGFSSRHSYSSVLQGTVVGIGDVFLWCLPP